MKRWGINVPTYESSEFVRKAVERLTYVCGRMVAFISLVLVSYLYLVIISLCLDQLKG